MHLEKFCVATATAAGLKFACGSDDLVWLAPFFANEQTRSAKVRVAVSYVVSVAGLVLVAALVGLLVHKAAGLGGHDDEVNFWIEISAAALLMSYAIYLAHEDGFFACCGGDGDGDDGGDDDDGDEEPGVVGSALKAALEAVGFRGEDPASSLTPDAEAGRVSSLHTPLLAAAPAPHRDDFAPLTTTGDAPTLVPPDEFARASKPVADVSEKSEDSASKRKRAKPNIVVVAILGSLDDFTVYFALAVSGRYRPVELVIGTVLGCLLLSFIVAVFTESERVAKIVQIVPVPLILGVLAILIAASAFFPSLPI